MASRKKVMAGHPQLRGKVSEDHYLFGQSRYKEFVPPTVNFNTADFTDEPLAFIEQFVINARRPDIYHGPRPAEAYFTTANDKECAKWLTTQRQWESGEYKRPLLLRKKEGCRVSLPNPVDSIALSEQLEIEHRIQCGEMLPQWHSDEDAELMTAMFFKDQEFVNQARAMFLSRPQASSARAQSKLRTSGTLYAETSIGKVCLPDELVTESPAGEYSLRNVPEALMDLFGPETVARTVGVTENEMDRLTLADWTPPIRPYEQMEADRRGLEDRWFELFLKNCLCCHVGVIRSVFGACGHMTVCDECAQKGERFVESWPEDLVYFKCPLCLSDSTWLKAPFNS